jgi:hypothetical protein
MKFEKKVTIGAGFKRSINLEKDRSDLTVLDHYVCPPSSENVLLSMCEHISTSGQSAFTWTGPYGSGKSSLAVFLSALSSGDKKIYDIAARKLSVDKNLITKTLPLQAKREIIVATGVPENPVNILAQILNVNATSSDVLSELEKRSKTDGGLILFIDEMGKFLEKATNDSSVDVYLFQQIAELANRSAGQFIFVGILHQSLTEYSRNLSKASRDEWTKIQGRFVDLSVNAAGEEQIDLISRAIVSDEKPRRLTDQAKATADLISSNKPVSNIKSFANTLNSCWPLHPVVACLLGPVSRKRFGQNQRSIFSFLSSAEPYGFQFFLKQYDFDKKAFYQPEMYWDYLRTNFESSILASPDAKIWAVAVEAVNKCAVSTEGDYTTRVMQAIAVIDIFKGNSGLNASKDLLETIFEPSILKKSLEELQELSLIRENRFSESYSLFEGSDFNIDAELDEAYKNIHEVDFKKLNHIASFKPIVAKRHYHKTGAMRWMDVHLVQNEDLNETKNTNTTYAFGEFLIAVPKDNQEYKTLLKKIQNNKSNNKEFPQIISVADNYKSLLDLSKELLALEWIKKNSSSLAGDKIARREVENRHSLVSSMLTSLLDQTVNQTEWHQGSISLGSLTDRQMASLASDLADEVFDKAPILKSEMLNRNKPSSNANAAVNLLLKRMIFNNGEDRLGIEGYPAEGGIFKILLEDTGIYQVSESGEWHFGIPKVDKYQLLPLWNKTDEILKSSQENIQLKEIYNEWEKPPFGIKKGLQTYLITSYLLAKKGHVAVYLNGTYIPEVDDLFIDYLIKNTAEISLRYVSNDKSKQQILQRISKHLASLETLNIQLPKQASPLEVARALVGITESVNPWVLRTRSLSSKATRLREILKSAHDPNKLIFDDIPKLFNMYDHEQKGIEQFSIALKEIITAYPDLLSKLGQITMSELQVGLVNEASLKRLRERAENVRQASGDFRIDALAARLANFDETEESISGIAGLAANKPIHDWIDLDVDRACIEIAVLCQGFKKAELYARVKGKQQNRHAISLMSGLSGNEQVHQLSFDVLEDKKPAINQIKDQVSKLLMKEDDPELVLAALTELSVDYMTLLGKSDERKAV